MGLEHLLSIYLGVELLKLIAATYISHKDQNGVLTGISEFQRDTAIVMERIMLILEHIITEQQAHGGSGNEKTNHQIS